MKEAEATFWDAEHWRKDPISQKAIAEIDRLQSELNTALERVKELEAGLRTAEQFISNGIEFGFIRLPDPPDPALETLPKIRALLQSSGGK